MKTFARRIIVIFFGWQVRRLRKKNNFKVIAVAGSTGKTSTKLAIARVLGAAMNVKYQDGNYNDPISVPLIFFGHSLPNIYNPAAWLWLLLKNELQLLKNYPYKAVVIELGTDYPGTMAKFKNYIKADIGVLTSISPEHMEYFKDLDAVFAEESVIAELSKALIVNADLCDAGYIAKLSNPPATYSLKLPADYEMKNINFSSNGCGFEVFKAGAALLKTNHTAISEPQLYSVLSAIAVANKLGLQPETIIEGLAKIKPVPGRMQILKGIKNSTIIDDSYNASPQATQAALHTLYRIKAPQKIAILGNMNELGDYAELEHTRIGELCDPKKVDWVITLGPDANKYLAKAALNNGCQVKSFDNPHDAGEYVKDLIKDGAVVLVKGSQNKVFAEEAIKVFLADASDTAKLVRQSDSWLAKKAKAFKVS